MADGGGGGPGRDECWRQGFAGTRVARAESRFAQGDESHSGLAALALAPGGRSGQRLAGFSPHPCDLPSDPRITMARLQNAA